MKRIDINKILTILSLVSILTGTGWFLSEFHKDIALLQAANVVLEKRLESTNDTIDKLIEKQAEMWLKQHQLNQQLIATWRHQQETINKLEERINDLTNKLIPEREKGV